jgi:hypothetical protein
MHRMEEVGSSSRCARDGGYSRFEMTSCKEGIVQSAWHRRRTMQAWEWVRESTQANELCSGAHRGGKTYIVQDSGTG